MFVHFVTRRWRNFGIVTVCVCSLFAIVETSGVLHAAEEAATTPLRPNIVLIVCDNLGYGDIGPYGSTRNRTPHLDGMAKEGLRLTHFYVTSGVCTPSRASIMTGCYPRRVGLDWTEDGGLVLRPVGHSGLHPDEVTLAEALTPLGYATALIGKWHLGDQPPFLPTAQGFGEYLGIPYSDDMTQRPGKPWPPLPLLNGMQVIEAPVDRTTLTVRYTHEVTAFIERHTDEPFFVCLTHATPGSTRSPFVGPDFAGHSNNGAYGDSVEEIDWSTGQILAKLRELKLDRKTLVVWTSDNGAVDREHSSNLPLRGWGYSTDEGGMRVPCLLRWPGTIPAGATCDRLATTMDLLPTFIALAGGTIPTAIDGHDISALLRTPSESPSPYDAFFYYFGPQLQAVRDDRWKLYLPLSEKQTIGGRAQTAELRLVDLRNDPSEADNVADLHPEVVQRLSTFAEGARETYGDGDRRGTLQRPVGHVDSPQPLRLVPAPHDGE